MDEAIFDDMVKISGVKVGFHERLREKNGVEMQGRRIVSIATEDGKRWQAAVFADCSYEGDLMAQSQRELHVGPRKFAAVWRGPGGCQGTYAGAPIWLGDVAV